MKTILIIALFSSHMFSCASQVVQAQDLDDCGVRVVYSNWELLEAFDGNIVANASVAPLNCDFEIRAFVEFRRPDGVGGFTNVGLSTVDEAYIVFVDVPQPDVMAWVPQADVFEDDICLVSPPDCQVCEGPPPPEGWQNCCDSTCQNHLPQLGAGAELRSRWILLPVNLTP